VVLVLVDPTEEVPAINEVTVMFCTTVAVALVVNWYVLVYVTVLPVRDESVPYVGLSSDQV
jgi:hypothetical protein